MSSNILKFAMPSFKQATAVGLEVLFVLWFICDFFKPLEDLTPYLLVVSILSFGIILFLFRNKVKVEGLEKSFSTKLGGYLCFFALSIPVCIGIIVLFRFTPPEGLAAATIPGLSDLQKQLLKIGQDVTEIKGSVGRIEEKIDRLAKSGNLISDPKAPEEFYHNARFYELKGNTGEALKAYENFLDRAPNYFDVHQTYQTLMNNTQGLEATRRTYTEIQEKHPESAIVQSMAAHLLPERSQRIAKQNELSQKYPGVGPIHYALFLEYVPTGNTSGLTIDELKSAKESLLAFNQADQEGRVKPYYVDKLILEEAYRRRDQFLKLAQDFYESMMKNPMIIKFEYLPQLVSISLIPKEIKVKKILYSIDDPNPILDTGLSQWVKDPDTQEPLPENQVVGKLAPGKHTLYAKYINSQGKESPILSVAFEVPLIKANFYSVPAELGSQTEKAEIQFQSLDEKNYQYFYSLNQPNPDTPVTGNKFSLDNYSPGSRLFYYGLSAGERTPVYQLELH